MFAVSTDWIFENLQIFIILAAVIASIVNKLRKAREEGSVELPPKVPVKGMSEEDAARVREEIMRKRAERERMRQQQQPASPYEAPRPTADNLPEVLRRRLEPTPPPIPLRPVRPERNEEEREDAERTLARQLALAEKMKELEARRQAVARSASTPILQEAVQRATPKKVQTEALLASARNPAELRRAIVMTEILGKPLALR